ncbi:predicted protein [Streptomyces viridochromogenes DSM 40736]|uniref:Predicted protein n=1 Tax=Streptomyces viridochromogenes (strain DSM 40736 / JCM 4977 / BCRC 1201 / Tue 494) TaxID=591159 RepID=D9X1T3_STRVT|nr:predicted protein [Streptomyces viridochromogenes DSM 40736]
MRGTLVAPPLKRRATDGELQVTDAAPEPAAVVEDQFTPWLKEGNQLLAQLGLSWGDVLSDLDQVSYATGVTPERIKARLEGAPPRTAPATFAERLTFLHETRRDANGKKHVLRVIAETIASEQKVKLTASAVHHLLHGRNEPTRQTAAWLEKYFKVPVGWCSLSEGEALAAYVGARLTSLRAAQDTLQALQNRGVTSVSARSTGDLAKQPGLLADLLPTLLAVVDNPWESRTPRDGK